MSLHPGVLPSVSSPADGNARRTPHLRVVGPTPDHASVRALIDRDEATASSRAERAVAAAEQGDDPNALGRALHDLAVVRWRQGDLDEAERLLHEALHRSTSAADPRLQVEVMTSLGSLAKIRGDFREALRCFDEALALSRLHSRLDDILGTLNRLGLANMALHRLDAADDAFVEALTIADALGGLSIRIQLEVNCAALQIEKSDYVEAKRRCDRAMSLASHLGDSRANAEAEKVYGVIARETGELAQAEAHLIRARDMARAVNDLELEGDVNRELAELCDRLGRSRETLRAFNRAHSCFTQLRARHELADVGRRMARLEGDFLDVVRQWSESIESKDQHTQGHCERVADLAGALAAKDGLEESALFWLSIGALLHDVGKLIVPAEALNKASQLTDAEWAMIRQHPTAGVEMLAEVEFPDDVTSIVRSHHERWDGQGYPDRLTGDAIPFAARILCIADVYDVLTTERSYKQAFSHLEAMEIMRRESGRQFDPQLFGKFEELVRRGTIHLPRTTDRKSPARRSGAQNALVVSEEDDLTGSLIRRAFVNVTSAVLIERRRSGATVSLLVIDVDQFKSVNDNYGHLTGDDALRLVAEVVREHLRPGQYTGRYAGDEFVVLLPGLGGDEARVLADTIRTTVGTMAIPLRESPGQSMHVTLSIGVATAPMHGESFEALFTAADRALFDAKREGRDKVVLAGTASDGPPHLHFTRFVGRSADVRSLMTALSQSVQGSPQVHVVIGEAGVGKSTLLRQLIPEARLRGAVMVTGRSLETASRAPYGPWVEIAHALHEHRLVPSRPWPMLERLVPALHGGSSSMSVVQPLDATQGFVLIQEIVALLRGASDARPIGLVLEDMQWADSASWDVLEHLLAQLTTERIFIALTVRSEDVSFGAVRERRQRLSRDERTRERRLERLTATEVREWLQASLHLAELDDELLDFVLRHTEGNPFLVTQLLRTLVEENAFTHDGTAWVWTLPSALRLPVGMSDLVGRRLDRLSPEALRILVVAAAIGRIFPVGLLAEAANTSIDAVLDAVDAGLSASVLEPAHEQDDDSYRFAHALLVDAVLGSVSPTRQRVTYERVGDLLASRAPEDVDRIAALYARSGNAGKAHAWCTRAAERALSLHALDVAADFLRLALRHASTDEARFTVHDALAKVGELSGRWDDVERSCDAMLAMPDVVALPARALPMRQRRLQARLRLGDNARQMEQECRDLLATAERLGVPADVVRARSLLVQTLQRLGRTDEAIAMAEGSLQLAQASGEAALSAEATIRLAQTVLPVRPREAIELSLDLIALARARRELLLEARGFLVLGVARMRTRDNLAGAEAFRAALRIAMDAQALDIAAGASMNLGVIEMRRGDFAAAHTAFHEALRLYTTLRNGTNRLAALYNLANLENERGDVDAAAALYRETSLLAEQLGADDIAIGAHAGLGLVALRQHDDAGARSALGAAQRALGTRDGWWFQGRERLESLRIRLAIRDEGRTHAVSRFLAAVERLEAMDDYSAAWLVADCGAEVAVDEDDVWTIIDRFAEHATVQQFVPLAARYTALRDVAARRRTDQLRQGRETARTDDTGMVEE